MGYKYERKFYNHNFKEQFLNQYKEDTRRTYDYIFIKTRVSEEILSKDLYKFTLDEIEKVVRDMNLMSVSSARAATRVIASYIRWALKNTNDEDILGNINPVDNLEVEWYEKVVNKRKKLYITPEDLDEFERNLVNDADLVVPYLLFVGVNGMGVSELLNLRAPQIDEENFILHLANNLPSGTVYRELQLDHNDRVDANCIRICKRAIKEREYQKENGLSKAKNPILQLSNNDFVIKPARTQRTHENRANEHVVYRRIKTISRHFDLPYLRAKYIEKSGMIYRAYLAYKKYGDDILDEKGNIKNEILKPILERFNVSKTQQANGHKYYVYSIHKKYINMDNIRKLYLNDE